MLSGSQLLLTSISRLLPPAIETLMPRRNPTTVFLAEGLQRIPLTTLSKHGPCVGIWWHNAADELFSEE